MEMQDWKSQIQPKFNDVLTFSQMEKEPKTDKLFEDWYNNKRRFIVSFEDRLIIESSAPVDFELSEQGKRDRIDDFISNTINDLISRNVFANYSELKTFFEEESEGILDNKISKQFITSQGEEIPVGMKIGKALSRYFSFLLLEKDINYIQVSLSQLIQENKVRGTLCLSVHPLDFLSLSENTHKWRSCHALDGEYRTGNLNYMADSVTVIAYLKSEKETKLPRFPEDVPWNDKKWRCLFFFDFNRGIVWAGRQYPFFSKAALYQVTSMFNRVNFFCKSKYAADVVKLNGKAVGSPIIPNVSELNWKMDTLKNVSFNNEEIILNESHICIDSTIHPLSDFIENADNSYQYNDLLYSSVYTPYYLDFNSCVAHYSDKIITSKLDNNNFNIFYCKKKWTQYDKLTIGKAVKCIHCGKNLIDMSGAMFCSSCANDYPELDLGSEDTTCCELCGQRVIEDNDYYYNGNYYCHDCYESLNLVQCHVCEEILPADDAVFDFQGNLAYCQYCWDHRHNH